MVPHGAAAAATLLSLVVAILDQSDAFRIGASAARSRFLPTLRERKYGIIGNHARGFASACSTGGDDECSRQSDFCVVIGHRTSLSIPLDGSLTFPRALLVQGYLSGNIVCSSLSMQGTKVIIAIGGELRSDVTSVETVEVLGRVVGRIECVTLVVGRTGEVVGDVCANSLTVEAGGTILGIMRCGNIAPSLSTMPAIQDRNEYLGSTALDEVEDDTRNLFVSARLSDEVRNECANNSLVDHHLMEQPTTGNGIVRASVDNPVDFPSKFNPQEPDMASFEMHADDVGPHHQPSDVCGHGVTGNYPDEEVSISSSMQDKYAISSPCSANEPFSDYLQFVEEKIRCAEERIQSANQVMNEMHNSKINGVRSARQNNADAKPKPSSHLGDSIVTPADSAQEMPLPPHEHIRGDGFVDSFVNPLFPDASDGIRRNMGMVKETRDLVERSQRPNSLAPKQPKLPDDARLVDSFGHPLFRGASRDEVDSLRRNKDLVKEVHELMESHRREQKRQMSKVSQYSHRNSLSGGGAPQKMGNGVSNSCEGTGAAKDLDDKTDEQLPGFLRSK